MHKVYLRKHFSICGFALLCFSLLAGCHHRLTTDQCALIAADKALMRSTENIEEVYTRNSRILQAEAKNIPERIELLMAIRERIHQQADTVCTTLDAVAAQLQAGSMQKEYVSADIATQLDNGNRLRHLLNAFKESTMTTMGEYAVPKPLPINIDTGISGSKYPYQNVFTDQGSTIAAITTLHKLKNDIRSAEYQCLARLIKETYEDDALSKWLPVIDNRTATVHIGDTCEAKIRLGEYVSGFTYDVYIQGQRMKREDDYVRYRIVATTPGIHTIPVVIYQPLRSGGQDTLRESLIYKVMP